MTSIKKPVRWKEVVKGYAVWAGYLFMLTIVGVLIVTLYSYFFPIDITSDKSVLSVALLFTIVVIIDLGILLVYSKPTPTLIAILVIISPILQLYKLLKSTDLINIDQKTPDKLKSYIPPKTISE